MNRLLESGIERSLSAYVYIYQVKSISSTRCIEARGFERTVNLISPGIPRFGILISDCPRGQANFVSTCLRPIDCIRLSAQPQGEVDPSTVCQIKVCSIFIPISSHFACWFSQPKRIRHVPHSIQHKFLRSCRTKSTRLITTIMRKRS